MKVKAHKDRPDPKPTGGVASLVTADCLVWLKAQPAASIPVFFFSPPYNKHRGGKASHFSTAWKADLASGYATYSDDMPHDAYVEWMQDVLAECWRVLTDDGAIFFQHKDQQHKGRLLTPDELNPGLPLRQRIIWDRGSGPCANRNFLRPSFEFIHVYAKPKFKFGKAGVITDIIRARPANSDHPAPFPVELPQAIISQLAPHHDTICDIFSGSGSTGVAALAEGRNYIGVELDAGYNAKAAERLNCTVETLAPPAPVKRPAVKATLFNQDCLKAMTKLADESVHLIAVDVPYGVSVEKWDKIIPMDKMFAEFRRILSPTGNIVMTAQGSFSAALIAAAPDLYAYSMVWAKTRKTQHLHKDYRVLAEHEDILVFAKGGIGNNAKVHPTYNPQGLVELDKPVRSRNSLNKDTFYKLSGPSAQRGRNQTHTNWPTSILFFPSVGAKEKIKGKGNAPQTQKPVALMDHLIRTFSQPGDVVLDCTMGSGTTGVAALQAGRSFIGMEIDPRFYANTEARIRAAAPDAEFEIHRPVADVLPLDYIEQLLAKKREAYHAAKARDAAAKAKVITLVAACREPKPTPELIVHPHFDYCLAA